MDRIMRCVLATALFFGLVGLSGSQELVFASAAESSRMLAAKDAFVVRMSPFDRAARKKTEREVSESQFLEFAASAALEWEQREKNKIESAYRTIRSAVASLSLPLPDQIYVIKTSGIEEGDAAYTRGNAIILPRSVVAMPEREIQRFLAHELFHISSRNNPALARMLYKSIGFQYCGEIEFPANLAYRKITNPDAPKNDYCIQLGFNRQKIWAVPILFSNAPKYDTALGGEFFQYLQLAMLLVETPVADTAPKALYDSNGPRLVELQRLSGFFEQVGQNTGYVIHPEEILADNFALLVVGERDVRSPEVLTRMQKVLASFRVVDHGDAGVALKTARH